MLEPVTDPFALARALSAVHVIDGRLCAAHGGATFDVINPATSKVIGAAAAGDATDVDRAMAAAKGLSPRGPR